MFRVLGASSFIAALLLICITLAAARIFNPLLDPLQRVYLSLQIAIFLYYLVKAVMNAQVNLAAISVAVFLYVILEHMLFSAITGTPANMNAMAIYLPAVSFLAFSSVDISVNRLLKILAAVAAAYLLIYVVAYVPMLDLNRAGPGAMPDDGVRGERLYLAAPWASFAIFYALKVTTLGLRWRVALALLGIVALWLSGSRTFQLLALIFVVVGAFDWTGYRLRAATFGAFMAITLVLLAGLIFPHWNPFEYLARDASAAYRAVEYRRSIDAITDYWWLGIGLPGDAPSLTQFLKAPRAQQLFPTDLGPVGIMLMLGLPGLLMYVGVIYFCTVGSNLQFKQPAISALQLNCLLCASVGWLSPMIIAEPNTMFLSLLVAVWVRSARQQRIPLRLFNRKAGLRNRLLEDPATSP